MYVNILLRHLELARIIYVHTFIYVSGTLLTVCYVMQIMNLIYLLSYIPSSFRLYTKSLLITHVATYSSSTAMYTVNYIFIIMFRE